MPDQPNEIEIGKGEYLLPRASGRAARLRLRRAGGAARSGDPRRPRPRAVTVADGRFAKPLDGELIERLAAEHDLLVTIEENVLPGGFGSGVLEHVEDAFADGSERARVLRVGLPDRYVTHGKPALLREEVGFTGEAVAERVLAALGTRETIVR